MVKPSKPKFKGMSSYQGLKNIEKGFETNKSIDPNEFGPKRFPTGERLRTSKEMRLTNEDATMKFNRLTSSMPLGPLAKITPPQVPIGNFRFIDKRRRK